MATTFRVISVPPDSELTQALVDAANSEVPVSVDIGGVTYMVDVHHSVEVRQPLAEGDALLEIVGMTESSEPTDIARYKDRYLAEAIESQRV
jgi:hypothetical protein